MSDTPSDNNKLRLRNTDTNRFKIETGHFKVQPANAADQHTATMPIPPLGAGATQKAVNLNDPMSLRETSKGKLHKITSTGQTASLLNPNAANLHTETIRLKVVKKSQQAAAGLPKNSSPIPLSGAVKPISLTASSSSPAPGTVPAGESAPMQPSLGNSSEVQKAPEQPESAGTIPAVHPAAVKPITPKLSLRHTAAPASPESSAAPSEEPAHMKLTLKSSGATPEAAAQPEAAGPIAAVHPAAVKPITPKLSLKHTAAPASPESSAAAPAPAAAHQPAISGITPAKAVKPVIDTSTIKLNLKRKPAPAAPQAETPPTPAAPAPQSSATIAIPQPTVPAAPAPEKAAAPEVQPSVPSPAKPKLSLRLAKDKTEEKKPETIPGPSTATVAVPAPQLPNAKASATIAVSAPPAEPAPEAPKKSGLKLRLKSSDAPAAETPAKEEAAKAAPAAETPAKEEAEKPHHSLKLKTQTPAPPAAQASATIAVKPPAAPEKTADAAEEEKSKLSISKKAQSTVSVPAPGPGVPQPVAPAQSPDSNKTGAQAGQDGGRHILESLSALAAAIAAGVTVTSYILSLLKM